MINGCNVLALIPARGGSKGLPDKNILEMDGKPLIGWSIETVKKSKLIDDFVISTDSEKIAEISREFGGNVPFMRPEELGSDTAKTVDVAIHALLKAQEEYGKKYDYLLLCQPTSPIRKDDDFDKMIERLDEHSEHYDAIIGMGKVHEHPSIMKVFNGEGIKPFYGEGSEARRQDLDPVYFPYGFGYIIKTETLLKDKTFYPENTLHYKIEKYQCFEVDDIFDFLAVESILKHVRQNGIIE